LNKNKSNPFISIAKDCFSFLSERNGYNLLEEKDNNIIQLIVFAKGPHRVSIGYEWREESFTISTYDINNSGVKCNYRSFAQYLLEYDPNFDFAKIRPLDGYFDDQYKKLYEPLKCCALLFERVVIL
jgi:hypothetical protein